MLDTTIITTDGSTSVHWTISVAVGLAERLGTSVHTLYIVDAGDVETAPNRLRDEIRNAPTERGEEALAEVEAATDREVTVAVRGDRPATRISDYAHGVDADVVAIGTRGHHGESRFLVDSVAERVVRTCPVPVPTVRQLEEGTMDSLLSDEAA